MKYTIIRDDDTSFFTSISQLRAVYSPLWEVGVPTVLAVIPAQRADVRVLHRPGAPYDPSIPAEYQGRAGEFPITRNAELCAFLNHYAKNGLVEIALHGYNHTYHEFATDDEALIQFKVQRGREILKAAFPDANITTFIAPYDRMSETAIRLVAEAGYDLCTATVNLANLHPTIRPYQMDWLYGKRLFTLDEYLFHHREPAETCLANALDRLNTHDLLILGNHYWSFFHEGTDDLLKAWRRFAEPAVSEERQAVTFQQLAGKS